MLSQWEYSPSCIDAYRHSQQLNAVDHVSGNRLLLNVTKIGTQHMVRGSLRNATADVLNQAVKIQINETNIIVTTGITAFFSLVKDLKPINNNVTSYMVTARFFCRLS